MMSSAIIQIESDREITVFIESNTTIALAAGDKFVSMTNKEALDLADCMRTIAKNNMLLEERREKK